MNEELSRRCKKDFAKQQNNIFLGSVYFQLTGNSEKTLKLLFSVDWK